MLDELHWIVLAILAVPAGLWLGTLAADHSYRNQPEGTDQ